MNAGVLRFANMEQEKIDAKIAVGRSSASITNGNINAKNVVGKVYVFMDATNLFVLFAIRISTKVRQTAQHVR